MIREQVQPGTDQPVRRRRRRWVTVLLVLLVLLVLGVAVLRLGGLDGTFVTVALLAATPYFAGFALLLALLSLVLRRRLPALVALAVAVSIAVPLTPRFLSDGVTADGQRLRVMTANLYYGEADPQILVRLVRDSRADVLSLQELTPAAMRALDDAGMRELMPHRVLREQPGGAGGGLLAKVPLRQIVLVDSPMSFEHPAAVVDLSGPVDIEIMSVHLNPPVGDDEERRTWQRELAGLPNPTPASRPRVMAGDFNATLDHAALNGVLDRGYADAAELAGEGLRPTWSRAPFGPPITIDHVLVDRRVGVASAAVYDLPGSDHNALLTELVLPRG